MMEPRTAEVSTWNSVEVAEGATTTVARGLLDNPSSPLEEARYRKAVRKLMAENERLRSVLGHCPKGIAVLDEHGNLCGYNREFADLLGRLPRLGEPVFDLFEPTDRDLLRTVIQRAGTTKKAAAVVRIEPNGDGAREIEFLAATLPSSSDRSIGVVLAGEDRTANVDDERARLTLDDANRRDAFALAALVARTHADQLRIKAVEALRSAGDHPAVQAALAALDAQAALLTGAAPERISIRPDGATEIGAAARRAARLTWIGHARRRIVVDVQIDTPLCVRIAEDDLVQVLSNVLSSSVHSIEDSERFGWVTISADSSKDRPLVEISIRDNGRGMTPHALQQCIESGGDPDGQGLGLAIARSIVEARGGALRILSEPDRGTTVVVSLPAS